MLPSLAIRNYRNLKSLDLPSLARVNLIAGKNNTGKTSLLEAVSIYAAQGSLRWIDRLLINREAFYGKQHSSLEDNLKTYTSLFSDREIHFSEDASGRHPAILIGPLEDVKEGSKDPENLLNSINIHFAKMYEVESKLMDQESKEVITQTRWKILENKEDTDKFIPGLAVSYKRDGVIFKLNDLDREGIFAFLSDARRNTQNYQFVQAKCSYEDNAKIWSKIALTKKEEHLIKALQIIEPAIDKITFVDDQYSSKKKAIAKLQNNEDTVPLQSMGDGINRILTIILALVNSENGYLLIDEFENGLHHKVQEDLWKIIFKLAKELNVQVFATTHSEDCVEAFENIVNSGDNQNEGQFLRLEKEGDNIKPVLLNAEELQIATDHEIEIR